MITAIDHIQIAMPAGAENVAEAFYSGVLGFERVEKPQDLAKRGGCWFVSGDVRLHLGVEPDFLAARKAHPGFLVENLDELQKRLKESGSEVVWDTQLSGFKRFYSADPFGNRLEFLELAPHFP